MAERLPEDELTSAMRRAQDGDKGAYRRLITQIGPVIVRWVRFYARDEGVVEDLYQDILLNVHRARHTYDSHRPFKPWLYSIVRNTVYDHFRRRKRTVHAESLLEEFVSGPPLYAEEEGVRALKQALDQLPTTLRNAVELIKIQGLSVLEAARRENVSLAAMKVRAHRGYAALEKILFLQGG